MKSRVAAGVLGILLGTLGYVGTGTIHIVLIALIMTAPVSSIVGLIEGILYLTKTDEDFHNTYVENRKNGSRQRSLQGVGLGGHGTSDGRLP